MAHVNFNNARIESVYERNITTQYEINLRGANNVSESVTTNFYSENNTQITTNGQSRRILNTPSRLSILYSGTFTADGTEVFIYNSNQCYKIFNINFQSGDSYSFIVDVDMNPS